MILLPAMLFMTAPGVSSDGDDELSKDPVLTQRHRAVTESAVILAKTVLPQSVELMTTTLATPAVAFPMASASDSDSAVAAHSAAAPNPHSHPPGPPEPRGQQQGQATWYDYFEGTCAHVTLPMGTIVTVTRLSTGASTTCRVADRGPFGEGRVIDLEKDVFAQLGDPSEGIFRVSLEW